MSEFKEGLYDQLVTPKSKPATPRLRYCRSVSAQAVGVSSSTGVQLPVYIDLSQPGATVIFAATQTAVGCANQSVPGALPRAGARREMCGARNRLESLRRLCSAASSKAAPACSTLTQGEALSPLRRWGFRLVKPARRPR
jgi:hypothetical protein